MSAVPTFGNAKLDSQFAAIFGQPRQSFHSEQCRQERIGQIAANEEQALYASLLTNEKDAFDVCDDIPGNVSTETMILLTRAFLRKDLTAMATVFGAELDAAVKRIAESRAIKHVEEHESE